MNELETRFGPWSDTGTSFEGQPVFDGFVRGYVTSPFGVARPPRAEHTGADIGTFREPRQVLVPARNLRIDHVWLENDPDPYADIFGNAIRFETEEGYWLLLAHFSSLHFTTGPGHTLPLGARLGVTGATGDANGIHLHIGLGYPDNPGLNTFVGGGKPRGTSRLQGLLDPLAYFGPRLVADQPDEESSTPAPILEVRRHVEIAQDALDTAWQILRG